MSVLLGTLLQKGPPAGLLGPLLQRPNARRPFSPLLPSCGRSTKLYIGRTVCLTSEELTRGSTSMSAALVLFLSSLMRFSEAEDT